MITLLVFFGLVALIIWGVKHSLPGHKSRMDEGEGAAIVFGSILLGLFLIVFAFSRAINTVGNQRLGLAYSTALQNYETTLNETKNLLSSTSSSGTLIDGSIEKMQLASTVAERLKELRDIGNRLNNIVVSKNYWSHEWLFGGFLWTPPPPANIDLYVLRKQ